MNATTTHTDQALIDGLIENPEFTTFTATRANIEAALTPADERDDIDAMLLALSAPVSEREAAAAEAERQAIRAAQQAERERIAAEREANKCTKCSGHGYFDEYRHIAGGMCYRCGGTGIKGHGIRE